MIDKNIGRRAALRRLLIIAGGALVLPACYRQSGRATIDLKNLVINEDDEQVLAWLAETLIPATDTPGGKELLLHLFVLKMVDDCHGPEDRQAFSGGLSAFSKWSRRELGMPFAEAGAEKRGALLSRIQNLGNHGIATFYGIVRRRIIQGYMGSQYVMTNLVKYELVPGRYNGYFPA